MPGALTQAAARPAPPRTCSASSVWGSSVGSARKKLGSSPTPLATASGRACWPSTTSGSSGSLSSLLTLPPLPQGSPQLLASLGSPSLPEPSLSSRSAGARPRRCATQAAQRRRPPSRWQAAHSERRR